MKKLLEIGVLFALIAAFLVGCSDDEGYSLGQYRVTYGTVENNDKALWIRLDNGELITSVASLVSYSELKSDDRLSVNYTILGEGTGSDDVNYYVRINNYVKCQSKVVVNRNEIGEMEEIALGSDLIKVKDVWFGGKYLNVIYSYLHEKNSEVVHLVSLVHNNLEEEEIKSIILRHNAYGDIPSLGTTGTGGKVYVYSDRFISFDILSLVSEEIRSVDVRLEWREYGEKEWHNGVHREKNGSFAPYGQNMVIRLDGEMGSMK